MNETLEKLRDIKPPVEVPDHSFIVLVLIVSILSLLIFALIIFFFKKRSRRVRRKKDPVKIAKERLRELNFGDSKESVYTFDEYFPIAANGEEELMKRFEAIWPRLEKYKYKRVVPPLEDEDLMLMKSLIDEVLK